MNDDFSKVRDMLRGALPEPDTTELARMRAGLHEKLAAERLPSRSWGWFAAAAALAVLAFALLTWPRRQAMTPVAPMPRPIELTALPMAIRHLVLPVAHARRRAVSVRPGMRDAAVLVAADGSSRLRIRTTDPNVVILLPLSEKTDEEQN